MQNKIRVSSIVTLLFFAIYTANLIAGAFFNMRILPDVVEALVLFATSISFVVAIILVEKRDRAKQS